MAYDIYPMWGEGSAAIVPQAYNFVAMNYANQGGNIARRQDFDRQDIANRQNYFQMQRAVEAEDAHRQQVARQEAERLALAHGESLRRNYQFAQDQSFREKQLKAGIESDKLRYAPDTAGIEAATKSDIAKLFMGKGEGHGMTDEEIALATGSPITTVNQVSTPFRLRFPDKAVDALNAKTVALRMRNPDKFDLQDPSVIEGMKLMLPAELRDRVAYDPDSHSWDLLPQRLKLRNPFGDPVSVLPANAPKAIAGWQRSVDAGAYNFAPTAGTATTPPSPVAPTAPTSPFREGQRLLNKRDGRYYVVRGGVPVPE